MNVLDQFLIPYKGFGIGSHKIDFQIDSKFFAAFEDAVIDNGSFEVVLYLDKQSDHCVMDFEVKGFTKSTCDRCLADISLPVDGEYRLHVKFSELDVAEGEVVYLHPETSMINVSKYIYDVIGLSLPIQKIYDCENDPNANCNQAVLDVLDNNSPVSNEPKASPWDGLNEMNFDK